MGVSSSFKGEDSDGGDVGGCIGRKLDSRDHKHHDCMNSRVLDRFHSNIDSKNDMRLASLYICIDEEFNGMMGGFGSSDDLSPGFCNLYALYSCRWVLISSC